LDLDEMAATIVVSRDARPASFRVTARRKNTARGDPLKFAGRSSSEVGAASRKRRTGASISRIRADDPHVDPHY